MAVNLNAAQAGIDTSSSPFEGRTPIFVPVAQGAAGTTQLIAADTTKYHKVIGVLLTISATGTLKFIDSGGDLTGALDVSSTGGFIMLPSKNPLCQTGAVNRSISLVSTVGSLKGIVILISEATQ